MNAVAPDSADLISLIYNSWQKQSIEEGIVKGRQFGIRELPCELAQLQHAYSICGVRGELSQLHSDGSRFDCYLPLPLRRPHLGYNSVINVWASLAKMTKTASVILTDKWTKKPSTTTRHAFLEFLRTDHCVDAKRVAFLTPIRAMNLLGDAFFPLEIARLTSILGGTSTKTVSQLLVAAEMVMAMLWGQKQCGNDSQSIVVCGIHEAVFAEIAIQAARKVDIRPPAFVFVGSLKSLRTHDRMSGQNPESSIFWDDPEDSIRLKVSSARTSPLAQSSGLARIMDCSLFSTLGKGFGLFDQSRIAMSCTKGGRCSDCKSHIIKLLCD